MPPLDALDIHAIVIETGSGRQGIMQLVIATTNPGKKAEYAAILGDLGYELLSLPDLGVEQVIEESGATYAENALLKARGYAKATGMLTLADDSGLEVDVLDGAPGLHSARYAGAAATDEDRCQLLLHELAGVPSEQRTARFRCLIALVWPDGREELCEGVVEGRINESPSGKNGFGYDPVFLVGDSAHTMAEIPTAEKNQISHRARAAQAARALLQGT